MSSIKYVVMFSILLATFGCLGFLFPQDGKQKYPWEGLSTGAGGNLSVVFGSGISSVYFNASTHVSRNVSATNQTSSIALFNVTNIGGNNTSINMSINTSITGFTVRCAQHYNQTGLTNLTISNRTIANISTNATVRIWCWADFYYANKSAARNFNISVTEG